VHEQEAELGLEGVGLFRAREVAAEALAGFADRAREAVHHLANARLAELLLAVEAGLAKVLRDDDVGGELRPPGGDLGAIHLEDDGAVGVRDDARPALPRDLIQRIGATLREAPIEREAARGGLLRAGLRVALRRRGR